MRPKIKLFWLVVSLKVLVDWPKSNVQIFKRYLIDISLFLLFHFLGILIFLLPIVIQVFVQFDLSDIGAI